MSLFDAIKLLIRLCHFLGLAPYTRLAQTSKWTKNRTHEMVTIVYLIITMAIFAMCIIFNGTLVDHTESGLVVAICIYSLAIICLQALIVLCETFQKRRQYIELLNLFEQLESILKQNHNIRFNLLRMQRIQRRAILFWLFETLGLLTMGFLMWLKSREIDELFFFLTYTLPHLIGKLRFVFWIILVIVLQENVNVLIKYVESFIANDSEKDFKLFNIDYRISHGQQTSQRLMAHLKQYYTMIWEASRSINSIVYWSFPVGLLNEFSILVFNCYFTMQILRLPTFPFIPFVYISSWAIMNLINVIFITTMCGNAVEAVR